jgi:anaerobic glycerol-3-phosphate dehydrogenase
MPKYLSSPTHSFSIPSIYDSIQLACRIYLPQHVLTRNDTSQWRVRGAIVAHPYASLGGCYDDPVVSSIGGELLEAGYVVGTFNFRYYPLDQPTMHIIDAVLAVLVAPMAERAGRQSPN